MTKYKITPLTEEIQFKYYGEDVGYKAEGFALMDQDIPVAIAGIVFDDGNVLAFEEHRFNPKDLPITFMKYTRKVMEVIKKYPAYAIPNDEIENAVQFLKHNGFVEVSEGIYQCQQC